MRSKTILFIHGMFMNHECWDQWVDHYQKKGYNCIAPDWPEHKGSVKELNSIHPNQALGKLTLDNIVDFYKNLLSGMKEKPILIGHSMGGLVVQILINKGFGSYGIAIDPAPPKGVFTLKWSFLKANLPAINPLKGNAPDKMSFERFQYAFTNRLPLNVQQEAYTKFVVPESRNIPRSSTGKAGEIDFKKLHVPLLIIAGEKDHIIPASLNRTNFNKYSKSGSVTEFKEFPGRTHFITGQKGWEEVADFVLNWIERN